MQSEMHWLTSILVGLFASVLSISMCVAVEPLDDGKCKLIKAEGADLFASGSIKIKQSKLGN